MIKIWDYSKLFKVETGSDYKQMQNCLADANYILFKIDRVNLHNNYLLKMFNFFGQGEITLQDVEKSIKELPLPEKIKAVAIYKRYKEIRKIEDEMREAIKQVEKKYLKLDIPILENISKLVSGAKPIEQAELQNLDKYLNEEEIKQAKEHLEPRKVQGYWQKVLSNAALVKEHIGADDEQLLKSIENISVIDEEGTDNFTIVFDFAENEIIANKQLTKKFYIKKDSPTKSDGTKIEWKGRNLCVKEVKKKQKNKKTGQQRVVTKTVDAKSFFNFFRTIEECEDVNPLEATEEQMQHREKLEEDFEIGGVIVDEVLPYSLEYFLGIEHEGDEDFGDDGEQEEEGEDDEQQEAKPKKSKSKGKDSKPAAGSKPEEKPECKNQ